MSKDKGKNKKLNIVSIEGNSKEEILKKLRDEVLPGIADAMSKGKSKSDDHSGHGCELDLDNGSLENAQTVTKSVPATKEEIEMDAQYSRIIDECNESIRKAKQKEREAGRLKAKIWASIRIRLNEFKCEHLDFNRKAGTIDFIKKTFTSDKE